MERSGQISHGEANLPRHVQGRARQAGSLPHTLLEVLGFSGYGIWLLLGLALALGVYSNGRGEALVPLGLGAAFIAAGPLMACLRLSSVPDWHGWRPGHGSRPTQEAMIALLAFLPMLAVAGLARGENDFWATRLAGAALSLASLAALIQTANGFVGRDRAGLPSPIAQFPLSRVVSAGYAGGLWMWTCLDAQDDQVTMGSTLYWVLGLLALALLMGSLENLRWRALQSSDAATTGPSIPAMSLSPMRFLAAVLIYALPCIGLIVAALADAPSWLPLVAAASCGLGKTLELRQYELALALSDT
ncbi:MAG TPA: hypothetical protein VIM98_10595 [Dyella sp.]|uniref:hypothetical protein n=1 Tax=Dyella sp. TaxID=1869338 RepID=UPI002F94D1E1